MFFLGGVENVIDLTEVIQLDNSRSVEMIPGDGDFPTFRFKQGHNQGSPAPDVFPDFLYEEFSIIAHIRQIVWTDSVQIVYELCTCSIAKCAMAPRAGEIKFNLDGKGGKCASLPFRAKKKSEKITFLGLVQAGIWNYDTRVRISPEY